MKKYLVLHYLLLGFLLSAVSVANGQSVYSFSGFGKNDSSSYSFYNPLIFGTQAFNNADRRIVSSGPIQLLSDTTAFRDTNAATLDIDSIPEQMIFYNTTRSFYIKSASMAAAGQRIASGNWLIDSSIVKNRKPLGTILFNRYNLFSYTTNVDTLDFYLKFELVSNTGNKVTSKPVHFKIVPAMPFETATFGIGGQRKLPDASDPEFIVRTLSWHSKSGFNFNSKTDSVRNYSYSGVSVVLDANNQDIAPLSYNFSSNGSFNLDTLNIYAETVTIKDGFWFPGTTINIYAKDLKFEDNNGKIAYLNTSPIQNPVIIHNASLVKGAIGLAGGDIHLHILNFCSDPGKRLITNGGNGQGIDDPANQNYMGEPGDAGDVTSTIDVKDFILADGGYSGNGSFTAGVEYRGNNGNFLVDSSYASWLHPNFFKILVNYYKDGFYNGLTDPITTNLQNYSNIFNVYVADGSINKIDSASLLSLKQSVDEIRQVFYNLANNLDYFGNPKGWVPMLSFEVSQSVYSSEVKHAMNILFLQRLINNANTSLEARKAAMTALQSESQLLITSNLDEYTNIATVVIPDEKQQIENNRLRIESLQNSLKALNDELDRKAQETYNNRNNPWIKSLGAVSTVCSMIPNPITQGASQALNLASQTIGGDFAASFNKGQQVANTVIDFAKPFATGLSKQFDGLSSTLSGGVSGVFGNIGNFGSALGAGNFNDMKKYGSSILSQSQSLYNSTKLRIDTVTKSINSAVDLYNSVTKVNEGELGSIRGQLVANDPRVKEIQEDIKEVQDDQQRLAQQLQASTQQMLVAQNNVFLNLASVSKFNSAAYDANAAIDHQLTVYAHDLSRKTMERLRRYHYYMIKAYEYRTLKVLNANLNLKSLTDRIQKLVEAGNTTLTTDAYTAVSAIYNQEVRDIVDSMYTFYQSNKPAQTISSTYRLSNDEISALNRGKSISLNLVEAGVFRPSEEDIRIVGLKVSKIKFAPIPSSKIGNIDQIDFKFNYPNYSRIKKNGVIYNFNNYNTNTQYPISWTTRYDLNSQQLTNAYTSATANSLLNSLLIEAKHAPTSNDDLLLYSRPAAWADIRLAMDHFSDSANDIIMDSIFIEVQYDYLPKPVNIVNIELNASNKWFAPTFEIDRTDRNSKKSGYGDVHRAYTKSQGNFVTATAPLEYGKYKFDTWTDRKGIPVVLSKDVDTTQGKNKIHFSLGDDRAFKARYVFQGPVLSLPDTVYLGDSLSYKLHIKNTGVGTLYWNLDSIKTMTSWIKYSGSVVGFDDTTITLSFTKRPDSISRRVGKLDVSSTETEQLHNYIYFVQGLKNPSDTAKTVTPPTTPTTPTTPGGTTNGNVIISTSDSLRLIYPNPTTTSNINIEFVNPLTYDASLVVLNGNGEYVMSGLLVKGLKTYRLDLTRLSNGNYFVKIFNNTGLSATEQIIIRR